ncbi:hypothetical protein P9209_27595 [Prescottella defluvii]|nr:hypothetical protein P9209_27595 [Prescottella defluvii]
MQALHRNVDVRAGEFAVGNAAFDHAAEDGVVSTPHLLHGLLERLRPGSGPGEDGSDLRGGLREDADLFVDEGAEQDGGRRVPDLGGALRESRQHFLGQDLEGCRDEFVLGAEVVVERGLGDVRLLRDILEVHALVAVHGEDPDRRPDDLGLAAVAPPGDPARPHRGIRVRIAFRCNGTGAAVAPPAGHAPSVHAVAACSSPVPPRSSARLSCQHSQPGARGDHPDKCPLCNPGHIAVTRGYV